MTIHVERLITDGGGADTLDTTLEATDARQVAEVSLALQNLAYALSDMIDAPGCDASLDCRGGLMSLQMQILALSTRLEHLTQRASRAAPQSYAPSRAAVMSFQEAASRFARK